MTSRDHVVQMLAFVCRDARGRGPGAPRRRHFRRFGQGEEGRRTRQSLALKTYEQPGQAKEVLQAARKRGMEVGVIGNLIRLLPRVMTPKRSKG